MNFNELYIGQSHSITRTFSQKEVSDFSTLSLDTNPLHTDPSYASNSIFKQPIVPGFLTASLFSAIIGTKMPGCGSIYLNQSLSFKRPVYPDEAVTATVAVKELHAEKKHVLLETLCHDQEGNLLIEGMALVKMP